MEFVWFNYRNIDTGGWGHFSALLPLSDCLTAIVCKYFTPFSETFRFVSYFQLGTNIGKASEIIVIVAVVVVVDVVVDEKDKANTEPRQIRYASEGNTYSYYDDAVVALNAYAGTVVVVVVVDVDDEDEVDTETK